METLEASLWQLSKILEVALTILSKYQPYAIVGSTHKIMVWLFVLSYHRYSLDEGATWYSYQFTNISTFRVYGMLTEPGEATAVFGIYGANTSVTPHNWVMIRVDFTEILC